MDESILAVFYFLATLFGVLMSFAHILQARKIVINRSAKDISLTAYLIFAAGAYIWLIYGILIENFPIIWGYGIGVVGSTLVLALKLYFREQGEEYFSFFTKRNKSKSKKRGK
jgi:MtN3 and saliva related transmembrane protein